MAGGGFHGGGWPVAAGFGGAGMEAVGAEAGAAAGPAARVGAVAGAGVAPHGPGWGGGWGGGCWNCGWGWGWGWDPGWGIAAATVPIGIAIAANGAPGYGGQSVLGEAPGLGRARPLLGAASRQRLHVNRSVAGQAERCAGSNVVNNAGPRQAE